MVCLLLFMATNIALMSHENLNSEPYMFLKQQCGQRNASLLTAKSNIAYEYVCGYIKTVRYGTYDDINYLMYSPNLESKENYGYDATNVYYQKIDYEHLRRYDACMGDDCYEADHCLDCGCALPSQILAPCGRDYDIHYDDSKWPVEPCFEVWDRPKQKTYRKYEFPDWNKMTFAKTSYDRPKHRAVPMISSNCARTWRKKNAYARQDRLPGASYDYDPMGEYDFEFVRDRYYLHTLSPKYTLELPDYTDIGDESYAVVSRKFWVSPHLVTQSEFRAAMGFNPSYFISCGRKCPAENVTWFQALAYANERSKAEGLETCYELRGCDRRYASCGDVAFKGLDCRGYRIPTDEEWRYVAKRLNRKDYAGMSGYDAKSFRKPVSYFGCVRRRYRFQSYFAHMSEKRNECYGTFPVATHPPDSLGLYDFYGNANIWVWDWYGYASRSGDSLGPEYGFCRIVRGGNFLTGKSLARYCYPPNKGGSAIGIRLVKTADGYYDYDAVIGSRRKTWRYSWK